MNLGSLLGSVLQSGFSRSSSGRMGNMLSNASRLVGGNQNLAVGGIGALAGGNDRQIDFFRLYAGRMSTRAPGPRAPQRRVIGVPGDAL